MLDNKAAEEFAVQFSRANAFGEPVAYIGCAAHMPQGIHSD